MKVPMDRTSLPDPGEWVEDWYTTWQSRKENPNTLDHDMIIEKRHYEVPEVGSINTVRLQIGESVSRVHPYHTSYLRRSKWKRKYLTRGVFTYR